MAPTITEVHDVAAMGIGLPSLPFHLVVGRPEHRPKSASVIAHLCTFTFAKRLFWQIANDTFMSKPELCFIQLAQSYGLAQLIAVGYELCGRYALDPEDMCGFRTREPLTSTWKLKQMVQQAKGMRGAARAQQAIPYILDQSASPMETILAMLLCLPPRYGGCGLPQPQLNHRIKIGGRAIVDRSHHYECDLYWQSARLALEYDSDMFHTGSERIAHDAERRRNLLAKGISVIAVTKDHVLNATKTDTLARLIASKLNTRIRTSCKDSMMRRFQLRQALLRK